MSAGDAETRPKVLVAPHPLLVTPAIAVDPAAPGVAEAAEELLAAMRRLPGCHGLSAPQLGRGWRLMSIDTTGHPLARSCAGELVIANPEVVEIAGRQRAPEGCLSIPGLVAHVIRATRITIRGVRPGTGELLTIRADAFESRCIQHQLDHLDGLLFLDRVTGASAVRVVRKGVEGRDAQTRLQTSDP